MRLAYQLNKSFKENWDAGPQLPQEMPQRTVPPQNEWRDFFGYKVASPIGIPACPLTTSKGITQLSKFGFDIFTYKTIRSITHKAHETPNIGYVACSQQLTNDDIGTLFQSAPDANINKALANSFGNASFNPDIMQADIAHAKASLSKGQLLITSVYGTEQSTRSL